MSPNGQKPATPPLVFLSLCLSLFAVALSAIALFMVNDQTRLTRKAYESQEIRSAKWDWDGKIGRVERYLDRARGILTKGGDKSHETADEHIRSVRSDLEAWAKAAEPRFQDMIAGMSKQVEELRAALRERSEQTATKLDDLAESVRAFREKLGLKKGKAPSDDNPK